MSIENLKSMIQRKRVKISNKILLHTILFVLASKLSAFSINDEQSGIYQTKHNLLNGVILPEGVEKPELCIWCHIPHDSLSGDTQPPKWVPQTLENRTFDVYGIDSNSSAATGPDVMVRACLTCHDGINAPNISLFSEDAPQKFNLNTAMTSTNSDPLQKNSFVHSHPVGVGYQPLSETGSKASLRPESYILTGWSGAKTIRDLVSEGTVRCTSCHDPHSTNEQFLRTSNSVSTLCKGCHNK